MTCNCSRARRARQRLLCVCHHHDAARPDHPRHRVQIGHRLGPQPERRSIGLRARAPRATPHRHYSPVSRPHATQIHWTAHTIHLRKTLFFCQHNTCPVFLVSALVSSSQPEWWSNRIISILFWTNSSGFLSNASPIAIHFFLTSEFIFLFF